MIRQNLFRLDYKMITRSQRAKNLLSLPPTDPIINVPISDLYYSLNNDYISLVFEKKYAHDPKIQSQRWSSIKKNTRMYNEFYCHVASKVKNRFIHLNQYFSDYYLSNQYLYIQKVFFQNPRCHVSGAIDGIIHSSLLRSLFGLEEGDGYYLIYFEPDTWNPYHEFKSLALLHYFPTNPMITRSKILLINKKFNARWLHRDEEKIKEMKDRIGQIRRVKKYAEYINVNHITDKKYLPNMKLDNYWLSFKKKISFELGEITDLWCCDDRHRQIAFNHQVYSWRDDDFSPALIGWTDDQRMAILEKILATNRQDPHDPDFRWMNVDADLIKKYPLLREEDANDLYVDFEYTMDYLYLIGVFYGNEYIHFWADSLSLEAEKDLIMRFDHFLKENKKGRVWYWHAEKNKWKSVCFRHDLYEIGTITSDWTDLCHMMRTGTATIYKSLDFKLKSIVNAFFFHEKIPFCFQELEECNDGKSSIEIALRYYRDRNQTDERSIEKYNRMDCESIKYILKEIKNYLIYN